MRELITAGHVFGGRYVVERRLGRGGMSEVYLAHDEVLGRSVALKVLLADLASDSSFVARFRGEATCAAQLNHPGIVAVHDWGEEHDTAYLVMEYVSGHTLRDVLRAEGSLGAQQAAEIGAEIAAALGCAHRHGVVHRDVKPANVLFTGGGAAKVTDFGIAVHEWEGMDNLTQTGSVMGTAAYLSPEQAEGQPLDGRSDVYALGVVLYETVTGSPPFVGPTPVVVALQHIRSDPPPPSTRRRGVPPGMEQIIMRSLAKPLEDRYQTADELRDDLLRFKRGVAAATPVLGQAPVTAPAQAATGDPPSAGDSPAPVPDARAGGTPPIEPPPDQGGTGDRARGRLGVFAAVIGALLLVGILMALAAGGDDAGRTVMTVVPDVTTGSPTFDAAAQQLRDAGFEVRRIEEEAAFVEPGRVLRQAPAAGGRVEDGATVTLFVSTAPRVAAVRVPDIDGQLFERAVAVLRSLGFKTERVDEARRDVPAGTVVRADPAPGSEVQPGSTIVLTVAIDPPIALPEVVGQDQVSGSNALGRAGFAVETVTEASATITAGRVIRTEPAAGTAFPTGATVRMVVSSGPPTATVPDVVGERASFAREAITNAGLEYVTTSVPGSAGIVLEQSPVGGSVVALGTTVVVSVGST